MGFIIKACKELYVKITDPKTGQTRFEVAPQERQPRFSKERFEEALIDILFHILQKKNYQQKLLSLFQ